VLDGITAVSWSLQEERVLAQWSLLSELVEADDFSASFEDALAGRLGDAESGQLHLGHGLESGIVGNGTDNDDGLALLHVGAESGERQRWSVGSAHEETLEEDLVELGVSSSRQEAVELDEHVQVEIIALGGLSHGLAVLLVADVNTHFE